MELSKSIVLSLLVVAVGCLVATNCKPIQVLKEVPGFIGVYIRHGNERLEDINPALAEAFHETRNDVNADLPPSATTELIDAPSVGVNKKKRSVPESAFREQ